MHFNADVATVSQQGGENRSHLKKVEKKYSVINREKMKLNLSDFEHDAEEKDQCILWCFIKCVYISYLIVH